MLRPCFATLLLIVFASSQLCWGAPIEVDLDFPLQDHEQYFADATRSLNEAVVPSSADEFLTDSNFVNLSDTKMENIQSLSDKSNENQSVDSDDKTAYEMSTTVSVSEYGTVSSSQSDSSSVPLTYLHEEIDPDLPLSIIVQRSNDPKDYPAIQLDNIKFIPKKSLGKGQDGRVFLYHNEANETDKFAVKISMKNVSDFRVQPPLREESHWLQKANLLQGKSTFSTEGLIFTPIKFVQGIAYTDVLSNPFNQHPEDISKHIKVIEKAIETQLEAKNIEHRDLHPGNILYDPDTDKVTIIDMGRAATSIITDVTGEKFNIYPYSDRLFFFQYLYNWVESLEKTNPHYDYAFLKLDIFCKIESIRRAQKFSPLMWNHFSSLLDLKDRQLEELENTIQSIWCKETKTVENWHDLKLFCKEAKQLVRETHQLANLFLMKRLNLYGNPLEYNDMYAELNLFNDMKRNEMELTADDQERFLRVQSDTKEIESLNQRFYFKLNCFHDMFQHAKWSILASGGENDNDNYGNDEFVSRLFKENKESILIEKIK